MLEARNLHVSLPHAVPASAALQGSLSVPENSRGIVVFVAARDSAAAAAAGNMAGMLHDYDFGTLAIDLLHENEAHFADAENHLPQLGERMLAVIAQLHREMEIEAIAQQPIGLIAAGPMTPLAVRVAALRDKEIGALVCHGGLVDLAGLQYLKVLQAPLLLIADDTDTLAINNLQRATRHIPAVVAMERLHAEAGDAAMRASELAAQWFLRYLGRQAG